MPKKFNINTFTFGIKQPINDDPQNNKLLLSKLNDKERRVWREKKKAQDFPPVPGPGYYTPDYHLIKKTSPRWTFSRVTRTERRKTNNYPGVGYVRIDYDYVRKKPKSFKFDKAKRFADIKNNIPGVGQYDIAQNWKQNCKKIKGGSFSTAKRWPDKTNNSPGPGDYNPKYNLIQARSKKFTFSNVK